jgi:hypothetical protein
MPRTRRDSSVADPRVLDWLLEEDQPGVRYRTLTQIMGRPESDPEVAATRARIPSVGWAGEILRERDPEGWWVDPASLYRPKYLATNWKLLVLADLGVPGTVPEIAQSCALWKARFATRDGAFGGSATASGHLCVTGNTARALVQFGFEDDPSVQSALDWLVRAADPKGGWSCFGSGRNLDSWEGLSAFAVYPRDRWTPAMESVVQRAAEFFLQRELHLQGDPYPPWFRLHYPVHYYYDVLVGLDLLTSLGYTDDPRLGFALSVLRKKRRRDGRWNLDALHPDVEGGVARWFAAHPKDRPTPWGLEEPGAPSKMVTLRALAVLERVARPGPGRSTTGPSPPRAKPDGRPAEKRAPAPGARSVDKRRGTAVRRRPIGRSP